MRSSKTFLRQGLRGFLHKEYDLPDFGLLKGLAGWSVQGASQQYRLEALEIRVQEEFRGIRKV